MTEPYTRHTYKKPGVLGWEDGILIRSGNHVVATDVSAQDALLLLAAPKLKEAVEAALADRDIASTSLAAWCKLIFALALANGEQDK